MATNQDIWGSESDWVARENYTGTNRTNMLLTGNFGDGYYIGSLLYQKGCLQTGYYREKLPTYRQLQDGSSLIDEPLDNSISYCGLGNESVYSKLAYLEYKNSMLDGDFTKQDDRSVTNFAFCISQGSSSGFSVSNDTSQTASRWRGSECRISPLGYNAANDTLSHANKNREVEPYVSIPVRNFILTPVVLASNTINTTTPNSTSGMDIVSFDWWDYMDTTKAKNYTTHPYILMIGMHAYVSTDVDNIDAVTGVPQTARTASTTSHATLSGVAVLSPLTVCDDEPMDVANPTQIIIDTYSYYLTRCKKATPASQGSSIPLFGFTHVGGNDTNYIRMPNTNGVSSSTERYVFFPHPDAQLVKVTSSSPSNYAQSGWYYLEYYDDLVDWIIEQIACFGLFFTLDKNTAQTGALNDPLMYLGVLDANGIGHGGYSTGEDNEDQPQWEWDTTNNSSYKPSEGGGGGDDPYGDTTKHIVAANGVNVGGKWYVDDNLATWNGLLSWCSQIPLEGDDPVDKSLFFGQNPIDCIIEARYVFVNDYTFGKSVQPRAPIALGSYSDSGGVNAYPFTTAYPKTFSCGSIEIKKPFGDFRDLSPFTTITLLLPFAGAIDLPSEIFMGHTCNLKETIDPMSGDLIYYVSVDNTDYCRVNGNCAMDLSINGLETATLAQTRYRLQTQENLSYFNATASLVGGVSGALIASNYGNIEGAIAQTFGGLINWAKGMYSADRAREESSRTAAPPAKISKSSSNVEWGDTLYPQIVVATAKMIDGYTDGNYKNKTGFATYKVEKIGSQSGPVVCRNVVVDAINCTTEEKQMIKQLLESGVYIK